MYTDSNAYFNRVQIKSVCIDLTLLKQSGVFFYPAAL